MKILIVCVFLGIFACSSSEVREIDMDSKLEEELRAEPDIFKDSKIQKVHEKDIPQKNIRR